MYFEEIKLYTTFNSGVTTYLKIGEFIAISEYNDIVKFTAFHKVTPVAKTFKITFEDLVDTVDKGKQFEYNGTTYLRTAGHRQALNLTTYCMETFI